MNYAGPSAVGRHEGPLSGLPVMPIGLAQGLLAPLDITERELGVVD